MIVSEGGTDGLVNFESAAGGEEQQLGRGEWVILSQLQ